MSVHENIKPIVKPYADTYSALIADESFRQVIGADLCSAGENAINAIFYIIRAWYDQRVEMALQGNQDINMVPKMTEMVRNLQDLVFALIKEYEGETGMSSLMRDDSTLPDAAYTNHPDLY